jgi:hypothetical protein
MSILTLISPIANLAGSVVKGIFGFKTEQVNVVTKAIDTLNTTTVAGADRDKAIASIIAAEANSESWLTRMWRPLVMCGFFMLVVSYFFGWTTKNLLSPMPENSPIAELFEIVKIGIMGYMPLRTIDKIAAKINTNQIINTLINKKVL